MAIYFTRERNDSDATTKCFELLQSLIEILSISLAKILAFEKYAREWGIFLKLFKYIDQNKCNENISPPQKGTADPLFQGIGSRICIMENEKKQFNGII
jgi:hypothetical protein